MAQTNWRGDINALINSLETITYYKHHYVRKTGLKRAIKDYIAALEQRQEGEKA